MTKGKEFSVELSIETDEQMTSESLYLQIVGKFPKNWITAGSAEIMDGKSIEEILEHEIKRCDQRASYLKDQLARIREAKKED